MMTLAANLSITACWIIFLAYWIVKARGVKPVAEKEGPSFMATHRLPLLLGAVLLCVRRWPYPLNMTLTPVTDLTLGLAAALCQLGLLVAIWARRTLAGNWSRDVTFKQGHELIQTGPYRFARHPIYTGMLLMFLAVTVAGGQLHCWLGELAIAVAFWIKLSQEESLMMRHFPEAYPAYKSRVKALVPFLLSFAAILPPVLGQEAGPETNGAASTAVQQGAGHRFICTDYTQGKVFVYSRTGQVEWEWLAQTCNDVWVLPSGNYLFNNGQSVQEVTPAKQVVFTYQSRSEIFACQRLANGRTFIGECDAGRLLEVDAAGKIVKELKLLPEGTNGGHGYMRNARALPNGNYLVAQYNGQVVKEYDSQGQVVREIPAAGRPHSVCRLPNGDTLISCGDGKGGARIFEVDAQGKTVWQVQGDELPGVSLKFVAGFQRLPNGNTVMANWLGHNQFGKAPQLIEVTRDKQVVWTFSDTNMLKTISSVQLLDVPGDVTKGEVFH